MRTPAYETMADLVDAVSAADVAAMTLPELDAFSRRMAAIRPGPMRDVVRTTAIFLTATARRRIRALDPAMTGCNREANR